MARRSSNRLGLRIALPGMVVVFVTAVGLGVLQYRDVKSRAQESLDNYSALVGNLVLTQLREDMMLDNPGRLQAQLAEIARLDNIRQVRVVNKTGLVVFADRPTSVGKWLDRDDPTCQACHHTEDPEQRAHTLSVEKDDEHFFRAVQPIRVEAACTKCHEQAEGSVLGVLITDLDEASLTRSLREGAERAVWFVALALLVVVGVVTLAVRLLVVSRVRNLKTLLELLRSGERSAMLAGRPRDEIDDVERLVRALTHDLDDRIAFERALGRVRAALEHHRGPVVLLDPFQRVLALNQPAQAALAQAGSFELGDVRDVLGSAHPELYEAAAEKGWALAQDAAAPMIVKLLGDEDIELGWLEVWPEPIVANVGATTPDDDAQAQDADDDAQAHDAADDAQAQDVDDDADAQEMDDTDDQSDKDAGPITPAPRRFALAVAHVPGEDGDRNGDGDGQSEAGAHTIRLASRRFPLVVANGPDRAGNDHNDDHNIGDDQRHENATPHLHVPVEDAIADRPAPSPLGESTQPHDLWALHSVLTVEGIAPESARFQGVLTFDRRLVATRRLLGELVRVGVEATLDHQRVDLRDLITVALWDQKQKAPQVAWLRLLEQDPTVLGSGYQLRKLIVRLLEVAAEQAGESGHVVLFTQRGGGGSKVFLGAWCSQRGDRVLVDPPQHPPLVQAVARAHHGGLEVDPAFDIRDLLENRHAKLPCDLVGTLFVVQLKAPQSRLRAI